MRWEKIVCVSATWRRWMRIVNEGKHSSNRTHCSFFKFPLQAVLIMIFILDKTSSAGMVGRSPSLFLFHYAICIHIPVCVCAVAWSHHIASIIIMHTPDRQRQKMENECQSNQNRIVIQRTVAHVDDSPCRHLYGYRSHIWTKKSDRNLRY